MTLSNYYVLQDHYLLKEYNQIRMCKIVHSNASLASLKLFGIHFRKFFICSHVKNLVVSLSCLDELDITVGTGILFQAADQEIELAPYMTVVQ